MSKYTPLQTFLAKRMSGEIPMTFDEIERLINGRLPPVAFKHRAWWSNNPTNNVMTKAWLNAGYKTERVDVPGRKLTFVRSTSSTPSPGSQPATKGEGLLARLETLLANTVTIPAGTDITAPTGEVWDAER